MRFPVIYVLLAVLNLTIAAPVTSWVTVTAVTNADGSFYDPASPTAPAAPLATSATPVAAETQAVLSSLSGFLEVLKSLLSLLSSTSSTSSGSSSSGSGWALFFQKLFGSSDSTTAATALAVAAPTTSAGLGLAALATGTTTHTTALTATLAPTSTLSGLSGLSDPSDLSGLSGLSGDIYAAINDSSEQIDKTFAKAILDSHNKYRALHGVGDLSWADGPYVYAKNNADNYDCSGILTHTHGQYGENLAAGFANGPAAVKAWYDEGETYDYSTANEYNHFTQVVWKGSTQLGCAYKDCSAQGWGLYIVCEYNPVGNVIGQNSQNVLPLVS